MYIVCLFVLEHIPTSKQIPSRCVLAELRERIMAIIPRLLTRMVKGNYLFITIVHERGL